MSPCLTGLALVLSLASFVRSAESAQRGTASYYTYDSCRREGTSGVYTASGERYDENAFTAALPNRRFGTTYRVCRTDDASRCVTVRHNDYGPNKKLVASGRIIDLSKGAFAKLASLTRGLLDVTVEEVQ